MRHLECRQRTNSDVWIHHVACKSFLDFLISLRHYTVIGNQLFISNDRNRVRWVVLDRLQDGACTDFCENLSENTLKGDLSNATTFNPPLFSLVDTFNAIFAENTSNTSVKLFFLSVLKSPTPVGFDGEINLDPKFFNMAPSSFCCFWFKVELDV